MGKADRLEGVSHLVVCFVAVLYCMPWACSMTAVNNLICSGCMLCFTSIESQATKPPPPTPPNFSFLCQGYSLKVNVDRFLAMEAPASQPANDVRRHHSTFSSKPSTTQQLAKIQFWGSSSGRISEQGGACAQCRCGRQVGHVFAKHAFSECFLTQGVHEIHVVTMCFCM